MIKLIIHLNSNRPCKIVIEFHKYENTKDAPHDFFQKKKKKLYFFYSYT